MLSNSVSNHISDWQIALPLHSHPILLITCMITDWIGLHSILLPLLIIKQYFQKRGQLKIQSPSSLIDYFSHPSLGQIFNINPLKVAVCLLVFNLLNLQKSECKSWHCKVVQTHIYQVTNKQIMIIIFVQLWIIISFTQITADTPNIHPR